MVAPFPAKTWFRPTDPEAIEVPRREVAPFDLDHFALKRTLTGKMQTESLRRTSQNGWPTHRPAPETMFLGLLSPRL